MSEALARVLAEHPRWTWDGLVHCAGPDCDWKATVAHANGETATDTFRRHVAEAVLASGVVVSADKVRAVVGYLRDLEKLHTATRDFQAATATGTCRLMVDDLLSEPATDAAPTGEAQIGGEQRWIGKAAASAWPLGIIAAQSIQEAADEAERAAAKRMQSTDAGHRSAVDATTPPDTHPSDPRPVRNAQEGDQR